MKRRLYFLFPDTAQAGTAVRDLTNNGVPETRMHCVARDDVDLTGLPAATGRQRRDIVHRLERRLWNGNLILFGVAAIALFLALLRGSVAAAVAAAAVALASLAGGALFALRLPDIALDEFHAALRHGEVLLMVDVSRDCVEDVEELMRHRHPEAVAGGSSWTVDAFGV
jgi:hypothetical protein